MVSIERMGGRPEDELESVRARIGEAQGALLAIDQLLGNDGIPHGERARLEAERAAHSARIDSLTLQLMSASNRIAAGEATPPSAEASA